MTTFEGLFKKAEEHLDYWVAGAILDFTEELARLLEEKKISRSELARRIGSSPAYITKVLRGNTNLTLASMVKLARALDSEVRIHLAPAGTITRWEDVHPETVAEAAVSQAEQA